MRATVLFAVIDSIGSYVLLMTFGDALFFLYSPPIFGITSTFTTLSGQLHFTIHLSALVR